MLISFGVTFPKHGSNKYGFLEYLGQGHGHLGQGQGQGHLFQGELVHKRRRLTWLEAMAPLHSGQEFLIRNYHYEIEIYYKLSGQEVSLRTPWLRLLQEMLIKVRNCRDHLQWLPRDWAQTVVIDRRNKTECLLYKPALDHWELLSEMAVFCNSWSKS